MSRTYNQDCILAYAFDLLGERWTFLVIRELFLGPRRFGDLHAALPGIGTNLLSKRLKELEEAGLIASTGEGHSQYRLTDVGEELRPTVRQLMLWSIKYFMERPGDSAPKECLFSNDLQPDSVALAVEMFANECALPKSNYVLQLKIDDHSYTYYQMNGELTARRGGDTPAVARLETDVSTLMRAMRGEIYIDEAKKRSKISGETSVIDHFFASITPGADVAFEVAEAIKQRKLEKRPAALKRAAVSA
ncbi:MAG: helix-turn-helix domain-containing protein [Parvularculaceae bacterium]|nr:helix-turn-helix domain-containing protein [Parvularculaceae bacterium]